MEEGAEMTLSEFASTAKPEKFPVVEYTMIKSYVNGERSPFLESMIKTIAAECGVILDDDLPPWELPPCCVERKSTKGQRMQEIEEYKADPKDSCVKKQLKGFLHKDSAEDKERLFEAIYPLIVELRAKQNFETPSERDFFFAYTRQTLDRGVYSREYKLMPQVQINGTVAKYKPYRADFLNHATKTIVEINGGVHNDRRAYDRERTEKLNELGYTVVVFTNEEIAQNASSCANEVIDIISRRLARRDQ